ncbi:hypothetical protein DACRYDRAFT_48365 [Dacryopinax primogenitus]|uniref:Mitochondrial intermembrane space import and assembly protein 40 n=1 Tax=Dacryopinax primogenitus (strain DJM 731) TaxID=1858805 RepID=M5G752_DACPD|nr:uncharacterized protein DACRYDRAFT_48365 [Dacryopinax primogenitus]EJU04035.1 hypothetical protein DACRYDRAFT_48365 [Dacryopinax primogenitus]
MSLVRTSLAHRVRNCSELWAVAASPKAPSDEEIAEEIIHEKAEEAEETLEESDKEAAFDPVTGEINWDCPCLGGMAHGPCGQQFRDAFSCFVYSNEEPKGINCVEKFRAMQDCFREHPDVYGEEIMGDDDEREDADAPAPALAASDVSSETPATILTDPRVVTVDELSATDVPPLPNAHPPASSPVLQTDSRTTGRRF